jgi:hypothetical protein
MKPSVLKKLSYRYDPRHENKIRIEDNEKRFILLFLELPFAPHILLSMIVFRSDRRLNDSGEVYSTLLKYVSSRFGDQFSSLPVAKSRYHTEVFHNNYLTMNYLLRFLRFGLTLASPANLRRKRRRQY